MKLKEAIDICKNKICDDVISAYCEKESKYCKELCENEDCYLIQAIETVLQSLEKLQNYCKEIIKEKQELSSALLDSIPKKKIENLLKEVYIDEGIGYELDKDEKPGAITVLKQLLEEK